MIEAARDATLLMLFAVFAPLFLLWAAAFISLYRRRDLSLVRKLVWVALILFTFYVGVALYFATRPIAPPEGKRYDRTVPRTSAIVTELERLHADHTAGAIDDTAYAVAKRDLLGIGANDAGTP